MRLWRRGPAAFCGIAFVVLVANIALNFVPVVGIVIAQVLVPLAECGLLFASLAADRGDRPRFRHIIAVAAAPPRALAAIIGPRWSYSPPKRSSRTCWAASTCWHPAAIWTRSPERRSW